MAATIVLSGVETYSSNMDSYSNSLSLNGINGPGGVGNYISCLNSKLEALQISIATYTSHINKQKDELEKIEDTIARNFENRLSGSAVATDLLSNNFGVTVDGVFYGFDESNPNNSRLIGVIKKIINNINNKENNIYSGLTQDELSIINKDEYSSLKISLEGTNIDNLLLENAYLKKNSHSLEDLLEELKILNNNEYVESTARNELKNKGYSSEQIELLIKFKNNHALEGWQMSDKEWDAEFSDVYYAMYPDKKPSEMPVTLDGEQIVEDIKTLPDENADNNGMSSDNKTPDGSSSPGGENAVTKMADSSEQGDLQNNINFADNPNDNLYTYWKDENLGLVSDSNTAYIRLKDGATFNKFQAAFGNVPKENITVYNYRTGKEESIANINNVWASDELIYIIKK